ncbi:MAG: replication-associated recombination protein A [Planctomycetes bacterium]|nr:replication-associated recombination protein A [Planctomycetota bacterium]
MSLFGEENQSELQYDPDAPLPVRMRPVTLNEIFGQEHFCGEGKLLRRMIKADRLSSLIFYGPPGTGKTSLAYVIARQTEAYFVQINATSSGVKELREILQAATGRKRQAKRRTVLFIDELHRFNRSQQDVLLPDVEKGTIILIGATTHNPFHALNAPLLSRSQIFQFKPLGPDEIRMLIDRALKDEERGLGEYQVEMQDEATEHLVEMCDGDARRALNALEVGVLSSEPNEEGVVEFDLELAEESIQRKAIVYDRDEDEHYDTASAFIKSMRGSDPDAALYWMAKMLEGGEDPRFIARRIVICAAEDVGNASPNALVLATAAQQAVEFVGMPEAVIPLAQAVTYIAGAPKSNAAYQAISKAQEDIREGRTLPVPDYLKDASYEGAEELGHGRDYNYAHDYEDHWVDQDYIPTTKIYYEPTEQGYEKKLAERLRRIREKRGIKKQGEEDSGD